jgi:hypothetical protein
MYYQTSLINNCLVKVGKNLHTRWLDYNRFYSLKKVAHFRSEHLVDFSTYLLHRFTNTETRSSIFFPLSAEGGGDYKIKIL